MVLDRVCREVARVVEKEAADALKRAQVAMIYIHINMSIYINILIYIAIAIDR